MTAVQLKLDPLQDVKIKSALKNHKGVCLTVTPTSEMDNGTDTGEWILSPRQLKNLQLANGAPTKLTFSCDQLRKNLHHEGGFLPLLASALIPIIGSAVGAVVEREIAGSGIEAGEPILHSRPNGTYSISPSGSGLYLAPWPGKRPRGYGLYEGGSVVRHQNIRHPEWMETHKKLLKTIL